MNRTESIEHAERLTNRLDQSFEAVSGSVEALSDYALKANARIAELEAALKPFADAYEDMTLHGRPEFYETYWANATNHEDGKQAARVLNKEGKQ